MRKAVLKRTLSLLLAFMTVILMLPMGAIGTFADEDVDVELGTGDIPEDWIDGCARHAWDNGTVTREPTCKEEGERLFTCSVCGSKKTETIDKTNDHVWDGGEITAEPTCKDEGVRTYTCTVCGGTKTEAVDKTADHKWNSGEITTEPTCKDEGVRTYTCTVCGGTYTEKVDKIAEHKWNSGVITTEPTCKDEGVRTYTCTVCNVATYTEKVDKTEDHVWNDGEVTKNPTAMAEGEMTYTCTVCGGTKTEPIDKLPIICGDVNGDGKITQLDSFYLARYIAEWEGYDKLIVLEASDLNSDGKITQLDSFILARHIAEWEGYETLPYGEPKPEVTMTYEQYVALTPSERSAFYNSFADPADFFTWFNNAKKEYEDSQNRIEIGEGGNIDLGV